MNRASCASSEMAAMLRMIPSLWDEAFYCARIRNIQNVKREAATRFKPALEFVQQDGKRPSFPRRGAWQVPLARSARSRKGTACETRSRTAAQSAKEALRQEVLRDGLARA